MRSVGVWRPRTAEVEVRSVRSVGVFRPRPCRTASEMMTGTHPEKKVSYVRRVHGLSPRGTRQKRASVSMAAYCGVRPECATTTPGCRIASAITQVYRRNLNLKATLKQD